VDIMIRTQIQLTDDQMEALRKLSTLRKQPLAELVRLSVQIFLDREAGSGNAAKRENARRVIGKFSSGSTDISRRHDHYLADAFSAK